MRRSYRWIAGPLVGLVLLLSACATVEEEDTAGQGGARIEEVEGTGVLRIVMTENAVDRLGMRSTPVRGADNSAGGSQKVIPYAAVFYGPSGETWTYTRADSRTFERAPIEIDRIEGNRVYLSQGPRSGTEVVIQGAAELFGVETGIDQ